MVLVQTLVYVVGLFVVQGDIPEGQDKVWNGALLAAEYLPFLLLAPVAGLIVDRMRPGPLMVGADVARMGVVLLLWNMGQDVGDLRWMPWMLALMGVFTCLFSPAKLVLLWSLGEDRAPRRAAWLSSAGLLASAVGVWVTADLLLGGWLQEVCGGSWQKAFRVCLVLDALTFAGSALLLWPFLKLGRHHEQGAMTGTREGWSALWGGLVQVGRRPALKAALLACFGLWMTAGLLKAVLPEWAKGVEVGLASSMALQGRMVGLMGLGLMGGALLASRTTLWVPGSVAATVALGLMAVLLGLFLELSSLWAQATGLFLVGLVAGWLLGRNDADAIAHCPPGQRGRVMAVKDAVFAMALVGPNALLALVPGVEGLSTQSVMSMVVAILVVLSLSCFFLAVRDVGWRVVSQGLFQLLVARPLVALFVRLAFRIRFEGDDFPSKGPVVVCANHASYFDPVLLQSACPRHVVFLMWDRVYAAFPRLFNLLGALPVSDEMSNAQTVGAAIKSLRQGLVVGIFPEGGLGDGATLRPFHDGAAMMALRTGAPVVPVAILGHEKAWPKGGKPRFRVPLILRTGRPIPTSGEGAVTDPIHLTTALRQAIETLRAGGPANV